MNTIIKLNDGQSVVKEYPVTLVSKKYVFDKSITFGGERIALYVLPHTVITKLSINSCQRLYPVVIYDDKQCTHMVLYLKSMKDVADFINIFNDEVYLTICNTRISSKLSNIYTELSLVNEDNTIFSVFMDKKDDFDITKYIMGSREDGRFYTMTSVKYEPADDTLIIHGYINVRCLHDSYIVRRFSVNTKDYIFEEY